MLIVNATLNAKIFLELLKHLNIIMLVKYNFYYLLLVKIILNFLK
jgi:hypothetical protein